MKIKLEHTTPFRPIPAKHLDQETTQGGPTTNPERRGIPRRRDGASPSDVHSDNAPSVDMDYEEALKDTQYQHAIRLIVQRCEDLSADNEKLIQRLHSVKRITKRKEKDVALLKGRLDLYSDEWRTAQPETLFKGEMPSLIPATNNVVVRKKYKKREKQIAAPETIVDIKEEPIKVEALDTTLPAQAMLPPAPLVHLIHPPLPPPSSGGKSMVKISKSCSKKIKRSSKPEREKDPNAPKRPANPFFQFCQERRSILMGELNSELMPGEPELTKQELTRQLANRWRLLDADDKQVYINMYETSKAKYQQEMRIYRGEQRDGASTSGAARLTRGSGSGRTSAMR